jgi:hypothetical protein
MGRGKADEGPNQDKQKLVGVEHSDEVETEKWWMPNHPTPRLQLRFADLIGKEPPIGMIFIDKALDLLGRDLFCETWGMTVVWRQQPFRSESGGRNIHRYESHKGDEGGWRLRPLKVHGRYNPEELQSAADTYHRVVTRFREGAEAFRFKGYYADKDDTLKSLQRATWSSKLTSIFYSGFLYSGSLRGKSLATSRAPVLIDTRSYTAWLAALQVKASSYTPKDLLSSVARASAAHAAKYNINYTKSYLYDIIISEFSVQEYTISELLFVNSIWKSANLAPYCKSAGKPLREQKEKMAKYEPELRQRVRQSIKDANEA